LIPLPDSLEKDLPRQLHKVPSKRRAPPTTLESTGNREFELEGLSDDDCAAGLTEVMGNAASADTPGLWTGDDMAAIGDTSKQDGSLVGTLNLFLTQMVLNLELELWTT
jgi:hypothetical protein